MGRARPARPRRVAPEEPAPLRNRIVRQDSVDPSTLKANAANWRVHTGEQKALMRAMLQRVGWVAPVMVNQRTHNLIDGHLRLDIALEDREPLIPVDYVDLSPEEEATVLAVYDPLGALAGVDPEAQAAVLLAAGSEEDELQAMLDAMLAEDEAVIGVFDERAPSGSRDGRNALGKNPDNVKMVVSGVDLPTVERALAAAGTMHRGRALTIICNAFLISIGLEEEPTP